MKLLARAMFVTQNTFAPLDLSAFIVGPVMMQEYLSAVFR
jgi:hypothetical protein